MTPTSDEQAPDGSYGQRVLDTFIGYQVAAGLIAAPFPAGELFTAGRTKE